MRSAQVLDQQNDLFRRFSENPEFWRHAQTCFMLAIGAYHDAGPTEKAQLAGVAAEFTNVHAAHVQLGYAYHVSEDMSALVEHAAAGLDDTDTFDARLAPSRAGVAYFDRPLALTDVRGKALKCHWIVWGPVTLDGEDGTFVVLYNDTDDTHETDPLRVAAMEEHRHVTGRWAWLGCGFTPDGAAVGPPVEDAEAEQAARLAAEGTEPLSATNYARLVHALWLLIGQPVTALSEPTMNRADRKRIGRMPINGQVSVIALRRGQSSSREDNESHVEWKHRWLVRGHWRWAPAGPMNTDLHQHQWGDKVASVGSTVRHCQHEGCRRVLARTWVTGHVKGPEGAPLVVKDKVYRVDR